MLHCVEVEPDAPAKGCLLLLHGLGADGHDLEPVARAIAKAAPLPLRIVLPHAPPRPISVYDGWPMPAWYDIRALPIDADEDAPGIRASASKVRLLIEREAMRGIPPHRIVLGGFSQGAAISLFLAPRLDTPLAAVVAFSGYLPLADRLQAEKAAGVQTPLLLTHGEQDEIVPVFLARRAAEVLQSAGCRVQLRIDSGGHGIAPQALEAAIRFVQNCLSGDGNSPTST